jgi:hypothetical protein
MRALVEERGARTIADACHHRSAPARHRGKGPKGSWPSSTRTVELATRNIALIAAYEQATSDSQASPVSLAWHCTCGH